MKEKLKAMYQSGAIDMNGLLKAVERGWVTMEDVIEIVGEDNSLAIIRAAKIAEISKSCNAIIVAGIDLELTQGAVHLISASKTKQILRTCSALLSLAAQSSHINQTVVSAVSTQPPRLPKSILRRKLLLPLRQLITML